MKTAVSIPDSVFDAAEQVSKRLGVSRSRLYTVAIEGLLKRERSRGVREALDAVYSDMNSRLDPALAAMQAASVTRGEADW
jgi:metal-responsive CopG/Arc/MetJ family transcriptional regulator